MPEDKPKGNPLWMIAKNTQTSTQILADIKIMLQQHLEKDTMETEFPIDVVVPKLVSFDDFYGDGRKWYKPWTWGRVRRLPEEDEEAK